MVGTVVARESDGEQTFELFLVEIGGGVGEAERSNATVGDFKFAVGGIEDSLDGTGDVDFTGGRHKNLPEAVGEI